MQRGLVHVWSSDNDAPAVHAGALEKGCKAKAQNHGHDHRADWVAHRAIDHGLWFGCREKSSTGCERAPEAGQGTFSASYV